MSSLSILPFTFGVGHIPYQSSWIDEVRIGRCIWPVVITYHLFCFFRPYKSIVFALVHNISSQSSIEYVVDFFDILDKTFTHVFLWFFTVIELSWSVFRANCRDSMSGSTLLTLTLSVMCNCPFGITKGNQSLLAFWRHVQDVGV